MKKEKWIVEWKETINAIRTHLNKHFIFLITLLIALVGFSLSIISGKWNMSIVFIMLLWTYATLYALSDIKNRFIFLIMNLMMFTFIIDRPFIGMFRQQIWWYFSKTSIEKALIAIFISELFLLVGIKIINIIQQLKVTTKETEYKKNINSSKVLIIIFLIIFVITACASMYVEVVKYILMRDANYEANYTNVTIQFPVIIRVLAALFSYIVFANLALLPNKKKSFYILFVFCVIGIPSFLLGNRSNLVLRMLFTFIYIMIRHFLEGDVSKWITLKMKITAIAMIPILILGLGAYNYIRENQKVNVESPLDLAIDFFHKQGTTFDTICEGFEYEEPLKNELKVVNYTFGDIIDYVIHNSISQIIFKTEGLESGNSIKVVKESNSMAHKLSFLVLGSTYLEGHGRGTSYIIETYMDGGWLWLSIYSLCLGFFLGTILNLIKNRSFFTRYVLLTILSQLFLLPRYSASGFLSFIVTPYFWIILVVVYYVEFTQKLKGKLNGKNKESI